MYFIDTNILVYAAGGNGVLTEASRRIVEQIAANKIYAISSVTVLEEVVYLMARWARHHHDTTFYDKGKGIVNAAMALMDETLTPTPREFSRALRSWYPGNDFNDLLIVETMRTHGIETIISADKGFDLLQVSRIDPIPFAAP